MTSDFRHDLIDPNWEMFDEQADARERRIRAESQQQINRRRPVIGGVPPLFVPYTLP